MFALPALLATPALADDTAQPPANAFYGMPIAWIEPANLALQEFKARHPENLDCFVASFDDADDGGFSVSFVPRATETLDGDSLIIRSPTTCGFGETFHFNAQGELLHHHYERH
ncbi:MAG: hypothetical protein NT015_12770 [Alphaproteobacteria bacterium]|nr:hypothetical protein [Alphaproteobacteria bacterium]